MDNGKEHGNYYNNVIAFKSLKRIRKGVDKKDAKDGKAKAEEKPKAKPDEKSKAKADSNWVAVKELKLRYIIPYNGESNGKENGK